MKPRATLIFLVSVYTLMACAPVTSGTGGSSKNIDVLPSEGNESQLSQSYQASELIQSLNHIYAIANKDVQISTTKSLYYIDDDIYFTIKVPHDGYLIVIAVEPDRKAHLLFPNAYETNNRVSAGRLVHIPEDFGSFRLRAAPPAGRSIVYAFVTTKNIDIYEQIAQMNSGRKEVFPLIPNTQKSIEVLGELIPSAGNTNTDLSAGKIAVEIKER